jgi:hypothetical protein
VAKCGVFGVCVCVCGKGLGTRWQCVGLWPGDRGVKAEVAQCGACGGGEGVREEVVLCGDLVVVVCMRVWVCVCGGGVLEVGQGGGRKGWAVREEVVKVGPWEWLGTEVDLRRRG